MKFWEKIFLCMLVIFEIFFVPSSVYLIKSSFKLNLNIEINSAISEHHRFCSSLRSNLFLLKIQQKSHYYKTLVNKKSIDNMIGSYLSNFDQSGVYWQVKDGNNKTIFSSFNITSYENKLKLNASSNRVKYVIRDIAGGTYLFITQKLDLDNNYYNVSYIKDVSVTYEKSKYLFNLLFRLNLVVSLLLIIVTIILSKLIVNPINKLIKSAENIASGNFNERVNLTSKDEIGTLSKSFNSMANVVEDKINELERISEDKQRFIDDLAHELRTPLTSIIGYADFLRTGKYNEETLLESLGYIYTAGKRMEKLSFILMDLIMLRKDKFEMNVERIEPMLSEVKNALLYKLDSKNIDLEILSEDLSLKANKDLLILLLTNLVDNAIKASSENSKISLKAYKYKDSSIMLEVKDTGVGIPEEDLSKVFEPFYMVDKSRERANNGVGLGLTLCAQIVKIHNSEIRIQSSLDEGTTIMIKFPQSS